jgi:hypothetical protein
MHLRNVSLVALALGAGLVLPLGSGCSFTSKEVGAQSSADTACSGDGDSVQSLVCGVGVANGRLAIQFHGQWFALGFEDGSFTVENAVDAEPVAATPKDEVLVEVDDCGCGDDRTRECIIAKCGSPRPIERRTEKRTYQVDVGELSYRIVARQEVVDTRLRAKDLDEDLRITRNMVFEITLVDPLDQNPWEVSVLPKRRARTGGSQEAVNEAATDPSTTTSRGTHGELFERGNVDYLPEVELGSAVKKSAALTSQMYARSNPALNRALDLVLPAAGGTFQDHLEDGAIQATGKTLDRVTNPGGSTGAFDMQRLTQMYMDTRRGKAGWSSPGTGERPMVETTAKDWRFRHNILSYDVYFPFLAGICGFEAHLHSYVAGALTYGRKSCFDGLVTSIDASGNLEWALQGGGGLGCNLLVASASAGLEAQVRAAAEFSTSLQTFPPRLAASVDLYSDMSYSAYFRVRVLFWSKKWEKVLGQRRLFQKHAGFELAPLGNPDLHLCDALDDDGGGCSDPSASCDVTGRCVRYDFLPGTTEPSRVDVGACNFFTPPPGQPIDANIAVEGDCEFLNRCSTPSKGLPAGYLSWACQQFNTEPAATTAPGTTKPRRQGVCNDADLWLSTPLSKSNCGKRAKVCIKDKKTGQATDNCAVATIKDKSANDGKGYRWEASLSLMKALGQTNAFVRRNSCSGGGDADVTIELLD